MRTAQVDLVDNQGNTAEGFHAASAGGTWQAAVFGFGGMFICLIFIIILYKLVIIVFKYSIQQIKTEKDGEGADL
ncbi:MAG TPA: hypothetical protein VKY40_03820 [Halanaerobiales bacterium]|nr:hypothetical protein [Halanaerobiales bacterium]